MAWELPVLDEFKKGPLAKTVAMACDMVEERLEDADAETSASEIVTEAIDSAIEDGFMYNVDQLAAVFEYGATSSAFALVYDKLYEDVSSLVGDGLQERGIKVR